MPVNDFNPDLISRYDEGLIRFINENFLAIKRIMNNQLAIETISTIPPSNPYDGQKYIDTTNNIEYIYDAGAANWLAINQWGAWTSFSGVVVQQTAVVARTVIRSSYTKEGRKVTYSGHVNCTAAGTVGGNITISVPASMVAPSAIPIGTAWIYDASAGNNVPLIAVVITSATIGFIYTEGRVGGAVGAAVDPVFTPASFTLAINDSILWEVTYESAT